LNGAEAEGNRAIKTVTISVGEVDKNQELVAEAEQVVASNFDDRALHDPSWSTLQEWAGITNGTLGEGLTGPARAAFEALVPVSDKNQGNLLSEIKGITDECPFPFPSAFSLKGLFSGKSLPESAQDEVDSMSTERRRTIYQNFEKLLAHPFIASPVGNGLQSHRTWEALFAGTVPIVLSSSYQRRTMSTRMSDTAIPVELRKPEQPSQGDAIGLSILTPALKKATSSSTSSTKGVGVGASTSTDGSSHAGRSFPPEPADPSLSPPYLVPSPMDEELYTGLPVLIIRDWTSRYLNKEVLMGSAARLAVVSENTRLLRACRRAARNHKEIPLLRSASLVWKQSKEREELEALLEACVERTLLVKTKLNRFVIGVTPTGEGDTAASAEEGEGEGSFYTYEPLAWEPPLLDPRLLAVPPSFLSDDQREHLRTAVFSFDRLYLSHWLVNIDRAREEQC
jgi:hypothetical protein